MEGCRIRQRAWSVAALLLLLGGCAADLSQAPERQLSARALLGAINLYQATLSPLLASAGARCRFEPSCSHYAEGAIAEDGALGGAGRAVWRIARCGPWTERGTVDRP